MFFRFDHAFVYPDRIDSCRFLFCPDQPQLHSPPDRKCFSLRHDPVVSRQRGCDQLSKRSSKAMNCPKFLQSGILDSVLIIIVDLVGGTQRAFFSGTIAAFSPFQFSLGDPGDTAFERGQRKGGQRAVFGFHTNKVCNNDRRINPAVGWEFCRRSNRSGCLLRDEPGDSFCWCPGEGKFRRAQCKVRLIFSHFQLTPILATFLFNERRFLTKNKEESRRTLPVLQGLVEQETERHPCRGVSSPALRPLQ